MQNVSLIIKKLQVRTEKDNQIFNQMFNLDTGVTKKKT